MTVTATRKDPTKLTMTVDAEFDASANRVWQLWADPRQLERWWGPPTYPATVTSHDLRPGGRGEYHMTGPEGDQPRGYWDVLEADAPHRLVFRDGFANDDGTPNDALPAQRGSSNDRGDRRRAHEDDDREQLLERRGHGAAARHGHGGGSEAGGRADRRHPGRGQGRGRIGQRQLT